MWGYGGGIDRDTVKEGDFLDFGTFWKDFLTQIHTRNCVAAPSRLKIHPLQQIVEAG